MMFEYTRRRGVRSPVTDAATFNVARLRKAGFGNLNNKNNQTVDLTDMIDQSYNYHSPRELRWHLAERFGLAPSAVALRESASA
ncbi:AsnC family transcriptional regulator [uncultured Methylobacterium sp.]|uniref:AsnC family transcriptional regulator n=1 Tax=uncultured Methylobacterium sp. TaxID=157278 RepID=UPI0035CAC530